MTYQATVSGQAVLLNGTVIPADTKNRQWRRYLAFISAGGTLADAPELALDAQKVLSTAQVSAEAAALVALRLPGPTDAFVFQAELAEAQAALADAGPLAGEDYPLLEALIDRLGADLEGVAQAVVDRQTVIAARIAAVHTKRSEVLTTLEAQATSAEVRATVTNISWPADAGAPNPA